MVSLAAQASQLAAIRMSVWLGGQKLLDDVSIAVVPGEVLALVGPNGAGKSTLFSVLSGTRRPSAGDVTLDGRALRDYAPIDLARRRAVLPQSSALRFPFTVLDVVLLGCLPGGRARRAQNLDAARSALSSASVLHLAHRRYPTLSGGEQQRVQLARVLAQLAREDADPSARYLLLDEPTASLDLAHQHEMLALAQRVAATGVGVFVIVHDLNLAARYASRVCVLQAGRIVTDAPPREALTSAIVEQVFELPVRVVDHPAHHHPLIFAA